MFEVKGAGTAGSSPAFSVSGSAPANSLVIDSIGRLGLGTSSPSGLLHAAGSSPDIIIQDTQSYTVSDGPLIQLQGRGPNATNYNFGYIRGVSSGSNNAGILQFATNNAGTQSVAMTIDSSQRVGIGTTTPGDYNANADDLVVASTGSTGITIASNSANYGSLFFADGTSGSAEYAGYLEYNHSTDALGFGTGGTEKARITSDGYLRMAASTGGIQFNGDTAAANALDDYEEGTWTPVYSGTWTTTPTTVAARYTKIGRIVHLALTMSTGAKTTVDSGWITGLPFNSGGAPGGYGGGGRMSDTSITDKGYAVVYDSRLFVVATTIGASNYLDMVYAVS